MLELFRRFLVDGATRFLPLARFCRPTPPKRVRNVRWVANGDRDRGPCAKAFRNYQVRYTHLFSRIAGRQRLLEEAGRAHAAGKPELAGRLQDRAARFPR